MNFPTCSCLALGSAYDADLFAAPQVLSEAAVKFIYRARGSGVKPIATQPEDTLPFVVGTMQGHVAAARRPLGGPSCGFDRMRSSASVIPATCCRRPRSRPVVCSHQQQVSQGWNCSPRAFLRNKRAL